MRHAWQVFKALVLMADAVLASLLMDHEERDRMARQALDILDGEGI